MEIVIIVAIWSVVVKRGVEDLIHAARGNTPHRYTAARQRRSNGAAGRYWGALWDDAFDDLLTRHNEKRERRAARRSSPVDHPDAAGSVLRDFGTDFGHWARGTWHLGWQKAARRRQERLLRDRPGRQTVPGEVVPNQDEREDGDQDERPSRPQDDQDGIQDENQDENQDDARPEPGTVQDETGTADLNAEDEPTGKNHHDNQDSTTQAGDEQGSPDTQEGTPTMTTTMPEVIGLDDALKFCDQAEAQYRANSTTHDASFAKANATATAYRQLATMTEQAQAGIAAGGVTGEAAGHFASAMEQANAAAADLEQVAALYASAQEKAGLAAAAMEAAGKVFQGHKGVQEQYNAHPDAGTREFVTAGQ